MKLFEVIRPNCKPLRVFVFSDKGHNAEKHIQATYGYALNTKAKEVKPSMNLVVIAAM